MSVRREDQRPLHRLQGHAAHVAGNSHHHWLQANTPGLQQRPFLDVPNFFNVSTCFEAQNRKPARKTTFSPKLLSLSIADTRKTLCRVNLRKVSGPDNIPGSVLRECADQLADIFRYLQHIPEYRGGTCIPLNHQERNQPCWTGHSTHTHHHEEL